MKSFPTFLFSFLMIVVLNFALSAQSNLSSLRWENLEHDQPEEWYRTDESKQVAENVLLYQRGIDGRGKNTDIHLPLTEMRKGEEGLNEFEDESIIAKPEEEKNFNDLYISAGEELFFDDCTLDWTKNWILDGKVGYVENSAAGMALHAGPEIKNDAHHVVLWTKQSFSGDLLIEYDYTRLDSRDAQVNIIYIQATGCGVGEYRKDIFEWNELRVEPAMNCYFDNMNVLHISYAALSEEDDYIRARRYRPDFNNKMVGTDLGSEYNTGFFDTGIKHHITIIKNGYDLYMKVSNDQQTVLYTWNYIDHPEIVEGPIGLRHMFSRSSLYENFSVKQINAEN